MCYCDILLLECSLPRPEPRVATAGLLTTPTPGQASSPPPLGLLSRLNADYTTYDDEVASFTENNNNSRNNKARSESSNSRITPVPNIKSRIEPKNEVSVNEGFRRRFINKLNVHGTHGLCSLSRAWPIFLLILCRNIILAFKFNSIVTAFIQCMPDVWTKFKSDG